MLAREFLARGRRPGILLRGWRRDAGGRSDEAELYHRLCPEAVVAANADRLAAARLALDGGAEVLLLDDGFQHRRLHRDLDLVLIDAVSPWGGGNCLPGGLLREFPSALADGVQAIVITRSDQREPALIRELRKTIVRLAPNAAIFTARHRPARLRRLDGGDVGLAALLDLDVAAFSGIARPEAFHKTLESLGARIVLSFSGPDHADFGPEAIAPALAQAGRLGARLVTTEKDAAKTAFDQLAAEKAGGDIWALGVDMELDRPGELLGLIEQALETGGGDVV
jgi:tetraacyldisaccharide 4'-kinase